MPLQPELRATPDQETAVAGAELIVYATPSHVLRDVSSAAKEWVEPGATLVVATKGIERHRLALMTDVIARGVRRAIAVVALSGPSFAFEVAARQPTAVVAASDDATRRRPDAAGARARRASASTRTTTSPASSSPAR